MNYWLLKSEPDVWSIEQQRDAGSDGVAWDGVRTVSYTHLTLPTIYSV